MKKTAQNNNREESLDMIRGTAVFTMILAHVVAFFHNMSSPMLKSFQSFGDTVSFTLFLLISGAASYFAYIATTDEKWITKRAKLVKRLVSLLLGYYLVAIVYSFSNENSLSLFERLARIIVFIDIPGYTEFLIPFLLYGVTLIFFRTTIKKLLNSTYQLLIIAVIAYSAGAVVYNLNIPSPVHYFTSLFAGYIYFFRFPVLQYAPIFIGGLLIGKFFIRETSREIRISKFTNILLILSIFAFFAGLIDPVGRFPYSETFQRWPPTLSFLSIGLMFAFSLFTLLSCKTKKTSFSIALKNVVTFWGRNAFPMYIVHIIILQVIDMLFNINTGSRLLVIALFGGIIGVCSALIILFNQLKRNEKNGL